MSNLTITNVFVSILLVMALFYGMYAFVDDAYTDSGITDPLNYSDSYADLQVRQTQLDQNVDDIKTKVDNIAEADANIFLVAWNGLTGLAATIRLFTNVIGIAVGVFDAIFPALAFVPPYIKVLIEIGLIATIVLLIVGAFKGEGKT